MVVQRQTPVSQKGAQYTLNVDVLEQQDALITRSSSGATQSDFMVAVDCLPRRTLYRRPATS